MLATSIGGQAPEASPTLSSQTALLDEVCAGLEFVRELSGELQGLDAKAELCAMVFESASGRLKVDSLGLVEALEHGLAYDQMIPWSTSEGTLTLLRELEVLRTGLQRVAAEALMRRIRTGLEQKLLPAAVDIPVSGTARDLIKNLMHDPELGGLARLARNYSLRSNCRDRSAIQMTCRMAGFLTSHIVGRWIDCSSASSRTMI